MSMDPQPVYPKRPKRTNQSIRPINRGSVYDVAGKLRSLARAIDKGELGHVTDVICSVRAIKGPDVVSYHHNYGVSDVATWYFMASRLQKRIMEGGQ